jgi:WXG100 family type VII secretion target
MSTGASIVVTFQSIMEASQNTKSTAAYMNQELDQLKRDLSNLKALWEGQAAVDYKALQAKWDTASLDLNQILADISQSLDQAHQLYLETEQSNAQVWA